MFLFYFINNLTKSVDAMWTPCGLCADSVWTPYGHTESTQSLQGQVGDCKVQITGTLFFFFLINILYCDHN
jgi:hypothetical protein